MAPSMILSGPLLVRAACAPCTATTNPVAVNRLVLPGRLQARRNLFVLDIADTGDVFEPLIMVIIRHDIRAPNPGTNPADLYWCSKG